VQGIYRFRKKATTTEVLVVATTTNREVGGTTAGTVKNAQQSSQVMMDYATKAGEINTEIARSLAEVWIEGLRKQTELSQRMAREFLDKAGESGHTTKGLSDWAFPSWWTPYPYDPFAFWRLWAQIVREPVRDTQQGTSIEDRNARAN
jgi:polyhydroxyalkanoate synthesis regulator phasin